MLRNQTTTPEIVKRVDVCATLSAEICDLVSKRIETFDEIHKKEVVKERVRQILNKNEYESIFGCTNTDTVISESSQTSESLLATSDTSSKASSKRPEAELAAKVEQAKAMQEIHNQQARLLKMENDWKLNEARMLAEMKRKETEMCLRLEEEKTKLQMLQAEKEVKVAAARVKAYNNCESNLEDERRGNATRSGWREAENKPQLNPEVESFHSHMFHDVKTQVLANSLSISRLPVPEPTTFTGDPLKFIDLKMSFTALIDRKFVSSKRENVLLENLSCWRCS